MNTNTNQTQPQTGVLRIGAHSIIVAADRPAPTVHDDLQAAKRRAWDAPMSTREPHAVDRTTLLLARVLAWAGGLVLIGAGIMLAVGRL